MLAGADRWPSSCSPWLADPPAPRNRDAGAALPRPAGEATSTTGKQEMDPWLQGRGRRRHRGGGPRNAENPGRTQLPGHGSRGLASGRSAGSEVSFGEKQVLRVQNLETFDFRGWDIGLFSPGAAVSAVHAPRAAAAGCIVIDNTSQFRMDPDIPLVVPEVNPKPWRGSPGATSSPTRTAHHPDGGRAEAAARQLKIKRVVVATYQSVSGAGKEAMDELSAHTRACSWTSRARPSSSPRRSPSTASPRSTGSWTTDRPRRSGRWRSRRGNPRSRYPGVRHLRARAGVHRSRRGG